MPINTIINMEFDLQRVGCTFHFTLEENIMQITVTDGVKKWAACIKDALIFTPSSTKVMINDVFDIFRMHSRGLFEIDFDKINDKIKITIFIPLQNSRMWSSITFECVGLSSPKILQDDNLLLSVVDRVGKMESALKKMSKSLETLAAKALNSDLFEFVEKKLVRASDSDSIPFNELFLSYCDWHLAKYHDYSECDWLQLKNCFEENDFMIVCRTSAKSMDFQNCANYRLHGYDIA